MIITETAERKFIQVGVTALRDRGTGKFLPSVPLYIEADEQALASQEAMYRDFARQLAKMFKATQEREARHEAP